MEGFLSYFVMRGCPAVVWDERQRCDNGLQYDIMNTIQRTAVPTFSAFVPLFFCFVPLMQISKGLRIPRVALEESTLFDLLYKSA